MLWAFALVVGCFLTETVVSQMLASTIGDATGRIVTDYSPSVVALASARAELHRMQDFVSDYVDGGGDDPDRQRVESSRVELDHAVASYLTLPFIPGERELWGRVAKDILEVRATTDRTLAAVERRDIAGARRMVRQDLRAAVDRTSADILSDIQLNGAAADADGRLIARRRQSSLQAAIALATASVALTVIAALLVFRVSAQHDALQRRHASVLEEANAELEIFASRLSHDILSPLSSTRLAIDAAMRAEGNEAIRKKLQRGAGGLDRAIRIAQSLFDFARAGARPVPGERGDVSAVVSGVVDEYRPLADGTGASLEASSAARWRATRGCSPPPCPTWCETRSSTSTAARPPSGWTSWPSTPAAGCASRCATPAPACRPEPRRTSSSPTCAAPAPPSPAWAWASRRSSASSRPTAAPSASNPTKAPAAASGWSCRRWQRRRRRRRPRPRLEVYFLLFLFLFLFLSLGGRAWMSLQIQSKLGWRSEIRQTPSAPRVIV
jgi:signal transduction histidine kinase